MQVFAGHTGPVQCGEFTPDGMSPNPSFPNIDYMLMTSSQKLL